MYLAHISEAQKRNQSLLSHLQGTATLAGDFADSFGCRDWGYGCGYIHDIGKYSGSFQRRLHGGAKTDHATAGALEMYHQKNYIAAYCIAGHHSGLLDGGTAGDSGGEATFMGRMKKALDDYQAFKQELELPVFANAPLRPLGKGGFSLSFFIRMLFSCLVDADFLDTEAFMLGYSEKVDRTINYLERLNDSNGLNSLSSPKRPQTASKKRGGFDTIDVLLQRLETHVASWLKNTDKTTINGRRSAILRACFEKGLGEQGIFQLTVPTGGGKTIASLAFALNHAKEHDLARIIYVIPYTSIIEQNAQIFRDILGKENVLEDHCNFTCEDEEELQLHQLAAENWDKPLVVTTNVQFFESLFSTRTSKCRKLHNIANSVIIFDEAQMLPVNYLMPCLRTISELVYNYHCTAVLCTATQPALREFFPEQFQLREICPDVKEQYDFFRRTYVHHAGELSEEALIDQLKNQNQVLCILNSRKRAQRVYEKLKAEFEGCEAADETIDAVGLSEMVGLTELTGAVGLTEAAGMSGAAEMPAAAGIPGVFGMSGAAGIPKTPGTDHSPGIYHLSTLMYPAHRKRLLSEIRTRLKDGRPCRLIATSLVEAGVDFDFQTVYRELAGIDSVIQAAGRCNREGKRPKELCGTYMFTMKKSEDIHIPGELRLPIAVAGQVAAQYEDITSPEAIEEYFKRLYHYKGEALDAKDIVGQMERGYPSYLFPFKTVAQQFHLIESKTKTVLIDKEPEAAELVRRLRFGERSRQLVREAGHYCVNVYEQDFENLNGAGRLEALELDFYRLRNSEQYTEDKGLSLDVGRGEAVFF